MEQVKVYDGFETYSIDSHPQDSRVSINESGIVQTLASNMGGGGGNTPLVLVPFCRSARPKFKGDTAGCNGKGWNDAGVCYTLNTIDRPAVVFPKTTGALMASGYAKNGTQEAMNGMYVVEKWTTKK